MLVAFIGLYRKVYISYLDFKTDLTALDKISSTGNRDSWDHNRLTKTLIQTLDYN